MGLLGRETRCRDCWSVARRAKGVGCRVGEDVKVGCGLGLLLVKWLMVSRGGGGGGVQGVELDVGKVVVKVVVLWLSFVAP